MTRIQTGQYSAIYFALAANLLLGACASVHKAEIAAAKPAASATPNVQSGGAAAVHVEQLQAQQQTPPALVAAMGGQAGAPIVPGKATDTPPPPLTSQFVSVTPATQTAIDKDKAIGKLSGFYDTNGYLFQSLIPPDTYTRLFIAGDGKNGNAGGEPDANAPDADSLPILNYKARGWLSRLMVGRTHSIVLKVGISVGTYSQTVTLLSVTHESTKRNGEVFARTVYHIARNYPLFLVNGTGSGEIVATKVELKGSDSTSSQVVSSALSALTAVTSAVAAPPTLLTKLNSAGVKSTATALDNAISSLFTQSVDEQQKADQPVGRWLPISVALRIPREEGSWDHHTDHLLDKQAVSTIRDLDYVTIGQWEIYFEKPRVSAFVESEFACGYDATGNEQAITAGGTIDDTKTCQQAADGAKAAADEKIKLHLSDVLTYPVAPNSGTPITLIEYLRQQPDWSASLAVVKTAAASDTDRSTFCRTVRDTTGALGFNSFDGYEIIKALAASKDIPADVANKINDPGNATTTPDCLGHPATADPNAQQNPAAAVKPKPAGPAPAAVGAKRKAHKAP